MAKMPEEMQNVGALLASASMIHILMEIFDDAENASDEVKNFVKPHMVKVDDLRKGLEAMFGKDFMK
jgi:hypothetical protein